MNNDNNNNNGQQQRDLNSGIFAQRYEAPQIGDRVELGIAINKLPEDTEEVKQESRQLSDEFAKLWNLHGRKKDKPEEFWVEAGPILENLKKSIEGLKRGTANVATFARTMGKMAQLTSTAAIPYELTLPTIKKNKSGEKTNWANGFDNQQPQVQAQPLNRNNQVQVEDSATSKARHLFAPIATLLGALMPTTPILLKHLVPLIQFFGKVYNRELNPAFAALAVCELESALAKRKQLDLEDSESNEGESAFWLNLINSAHSMSRDAIANELAKRYPLAMDLQDFGAHMAGTLARLYMAYDLCAYIQQEPDVARLQTKFTDAPALPMWAYCIARAKEIIATFRVTESPEKNLHMNAGTLLKDGTAAVAPEVYVKLVLIQRGNTIQVTPIETTIVRTTPMGEGQGRDFGGGGEAGGHGSYRGRGRGGGSGADNSAAKYSSTNIRPATTETKDPSGKRRPVLTDHQGKAVECERCYKWSANDYSAKKKGPLYFTQHNAPDCTYFDQHGNDLPPPKKFQAHRGGRGGARGGRGFRGAGRGRN